MGHRGHGNDPVGDVATAPASIFDLSGCRSASGLDEQQPKKLLGRAEQLIGEQDKKSEKWTAMKCYTSDDGFQRIFYTEDEIE